MEKGGSHMEVDGPKGRAISGEILSDYEQCLLLFVTVSITILSPLNLRAVPWPLSCTHAHIRAHTKQHIHPHQMASHPKGEIILQIWKAQ